MKIAIITAATISIPRFRIDMIDEFVRRGAQVIVFGDESTEEWEPYFAEHGVSYRTYHVSRNGTNPISDLRTMRELGSLLEEELPDKVFTYQVKPNIYGTLAAHRVGIEDVYVMMGGLGSVFRAEDAKSRIMGTVVGAEYKVALRRARKVFFQNEEDVDLFASRGIVDRGKVVMVRGSGVNLDRYPRLPLSGNMSFLFVGRLVRGKGVLDYVEAAKIVKRLHPDAEFHLVGPFDTNPTAVSEDELRPYIENDTVIYHGEQADVRPFLEACSCFVLPSYYGEGTPKSALEAMATGRPLIVADAVGCREVVRNGSNGFLVPPRNPEALAKAMESVVSDGDRLEAMAEASRAMAEEVFDVRKVNSTICETMGL